jgi:hypothetical protein
MMTMEPYYSFTEVPSNEQCTFMMRTVDGRFAHHIMNEDRRLPSHLRDVDSMRVVGVFAAIRICNGKCKCQSIGTKTVSINL